MGWLLATCLNAVEQLILEEDFLKVFWVGLVAASLVGVVVMDGLIEWEVFDSIKPIFYHSCKGEGSFDMPMNFNYSMTIPLNGLLGGDDFFLFDLLLPYPCEREGFSMYRSISSSAFSVR